MPQGGFGGPKKPFQVFGPHFWPRAPPPNLSPDFDIMVAENMLSQLSDNFYKIESSSMFVKDVVSQTLVIASPRNSFGILL